VFLTTRQESARRGYSEDIQTAYERNKDSVCTMDEKGNTPLHWATHFGNFETSGLLLQLGADPKAVNDDGDTALHLAAKNNHPRICELLTCKGTDSMRHMRNHDGKTPMDLARNQEVRIALR
jgi:ankyrin repeat protein